MSRTPGQEPDADKALKKVVETSAKQWQNFEGDYCDDITCVIQIFLSFLQNFPSFHIDAD